MTTSPMQIIPIQTVHGVSSPIVRGVSVTPANVSGEDDEIDQQHANTTQLYRDETAERLKKVDPDSAS